MSGRATGYFLSKPGARVVRDLVAPRGLISASRRLSTSPATDLGLRSMEESLIVRTPDRCAGCARVADTHVAVWVLVEAKRQGLTDSDLLREYPSLDKTSLQAAWDYAEKHSSEVQRDIDTGSRVLADIFKATSTANVTVGAAGSGFSINEQNKALDGDLSAYKGLWIALVGGKVVDADLSHNALESRLRANGLLNGALFAKL